MALLTKHVKLVVQLSVQVSIRKVVNVKPPGLAASLAFPTRLLDCLLPALLPPIALEVFSVPGFRLTPSPRLCLALSSRFGRLLHLRPGSPVGECLIGLPLSFVARVPPQALAHNSPQSHVYKTGREGGLLIIIGVIVLVPDRGVYRPGRALIPAVVLRKSVV